MIAAIVAGLFLASCGSDGSNTSSSTTDSTTTATKQAAAQAAPKLKLGMNLVGLSNYSTEDALLNHFKLAGAWFVRDQTVDKTLLNADGWPTAMPATGYWETDVPLGSTTNQPTNNFVVRWKGTGQVDVGIVGKTTYGDHKITIENVYGSALINIMSTSSSDPVRDISVVREDLVTNYDAGQIFNPTFLARIVKLFPTIRTMDWDNINNSTESAWADRQKPTDAFWSRMPLEMEVALANVAGADLWKTIPAMATDDYVRQTLAYIRDNLSPNLKVHVEWSNEVWNGSFSQNAMALEESQTRWNITNWGACTFYGYRAAQVASIGWSVFGKDSTQFLPVLAGWYGWSGPDVNDAMTKGVSLAQLGAVKDLFREYAVAPYFGDALGVGPGNEADRSIVLGWAQDTTGAGLDKAFQQIEHGGLLHTTGTDLDVMRDGYEPIHAAWAKANGLTLVAYEGGLSYYYFMSDLENKPALGAFFAKLVADPRMGALYTRWAQDFSANGGKLIAAYNDVGEIGEFGPWGSLPDLYAPDTPRYAALKALATATN